MRTIHINRLLKHNTVYSLLEDGNIIYTSYTPYALLDTPTTLLATERHRNWLPEYVMFRLIKHIDKLELIVHDDLVSRYIIKHGKYKVPREEQHRIRLISF